MSGLRPELYKLVPITQTWINCLKGLLYHSHVNWSAWYTSNPSSESKSKERDWSKDTNSLFYLFSISIIETVCLLKILIYVPWVYLNNCYFAYNWNSWWRSHLSWRTPLAGYLKLDFLKLFLNSKAFKIQHTKCKYIYIFLLFNLCYTTIM